MSGLAPAPKPATLAPDEQARIDALIETCVAQLGEHLGAHLGTQLGAQVGEQTGALLPVLHAIQEELGFIPPPAVALIAHRLNLSRAEVHGVLSFYPDFHLEPRGKNAVQICRAEACQAVGAAALEAHAKQALGCEMHRTTADGSVTLEPVYCLGNCACGPSVRVGDDIHGRVDAARFDALIDQLHDRLRSGR